MGGAFIAIADDATAASWNPGGLIRLQKPECSVVLSYINRKNSNPFSNIDNNSTRMSVDDINLNYFSIAYPFNNRNMIVSLNYQHLFDFNQYFNFNYHSSDPSYIQPVHYEFKQKGNLYALGLAFSTKLSHNFWAGITVNYWGDFIFPNKWENNFNETGARILPRPPATNGVVRNYISNYREEYIFSGWNMNIGFLWRLNKFRIGGIIKTPFSADIDYKISTEYTQIIPKDPTSNSYIANVLKFDTKIRMPLSYGLGIAFRYSDELSISGDIYITNWNEYEFENIYGEKTSPISGKQMKNSDIHPTTWYRCGIEYLIKDKDYLLPIRGGIFYDPSPAEGSPDDYYGFTIGTGFSISKKHFIDIAYLFRFGDNVGESSIQESSFSQNIREHKFYTSIIFQL